LNEQEKKLLAEEKKLEIESSRLLKEAKKFK